MKKILLILLLTLPFASIAQPPGGGRLGDGRERLEALQIAYLTRELNLTTQEAEKFWPVYNKYQADMKTALKKNESDEDVLDKQQHALDIRKKYKNDFSKIIGADRTNKLYEAEMRFREMVKRELQNRQRRRLSISHAAAGRAVLVLHVLAHPCGHAGPLLRRVQGRRRGGMALRADGRNEPGPLRITIRE